MQFTKPQQDPEFSESPHPPMASRTRPPWLTGRLAENIPGHERSFPQR
jgi:hypothetical protein